MALRTNSSNLEPIARDSIAALSTERRFIDSLKSQTAAFAKCATKTRKNCSRKNVHELRVSIRRLRVSHWMAVRASEIRGGQLRSELKNLGQTSGICRELDVAIRDAGDYGLKSQQLRKIRRKKQVSLLKSLQPAKVNKVVRALESLPLNLSNDSSFSIDRSFKIMHHRLQELRLQKSFRDEELHDLRIFVKKLRYALESIGRGAQPLQKLQSLLGQAHDLQTLQSYFKEIRIIRRDIEVQLRKSRPSIAPALRFAEEQLRLAAQVPRAHAAALEVSH